MAEEHSHEAAGHHHVTPVRTYLMVFGALLVLMVLTIGVAFIDLGVLAKPVALAIAFTKAGLIMYYFMHLRDSTNLPWIFAGSGFLMLFILLLIGMADYVARGGVINQTFPAAPAYREPVYSLFMSLMHLL